MLRFYLAQFQVRFMFRVAVATYLMLATLAGPAWCCCLFDRLPIPTIAAVTEETPESVPAPSRSCCCQRQAPSEDPTTTPTKSEQQPDAPRDRCPCKEQRSNENIPVAPEIQKQEVQVRGASPLVEYLHAINLTCLSADVVAPFSAMGHVLSRPYYLTGSDLLCAIQVYRC